MRVLFINPPECAASGLIDLAEFEPLGLEILAASLPHHDTHLIDLIFEEKSVETAISEFKPDVICMGCFTSQVYMVKELLRLAKRCKPDVVTIVGGYHPTFMPGDFDEPYIDILGIGPGVQTLVEVIDTLEDGGDTCTVPGLYVRRDGEMFRTPARVYPKTLDNEPFPDRRISARYRKKYHVFGVGPIAVLRTSEGCPYRCKFCCIWNFTGGAYRVRSPELVADELEQIEEDYVYIFDDDFLFSRPRVQALYDAIASRGLKKKYWCFGRADFICDNTDLVEKWAGLGMTNVYIGMEACTDAELDALNKRSTVEINTEAVQILRRNGITPDLGFIMRPESTKKDFDALLAYVKSLGIHRDGYAEYMSLTPLPGTELWDEMQDDLVTRDFRFFDLIYPVLKTKMPIKPYFRELTKLYVRTYLNLGLFNRTIRGNPLGLNPLGTFKSVIASAKFLWKLLKACCMGTRGYVPRSFGSSRDHAD
ncbi:MAG: radical SAM protein [Candidatus Tritonobacter lacicola]|nr:radical SAM protein [Candidatus Tritonobacter lacicola]